MAKQQRFCMKLVREVLKLKWEKSKSNREIGKILSISKSTVSVYLSRVKTLGIDNIEQLNQLNDDELKEKMFPRTKDKYNELDFEYIDKELRRKHVTLMLLWEEEAQKNPDIFGYTRFCGLYKEWKKDKKITMRQNHKAGEKAFIDYAGMTIPIHNNKTKEIINAQIFVMVLGASDIAYVEATHTQGTKDFIGSNIRSFEYFGGAPEILVPDNLKSGVNMASKYEPVINQSYRALAEHYGSVVIPSRVRRPQDKAKVENGVLIASRWILAKLRDMKFFSLDELNEVIWELLEEYNNKKFQKLDYSRRSLFEEIEKNELKALPTSRFEIAEWKKAKANIDYHVTVDGAYYSVPYKIRGKELQVRLTNRIVEIFYQGKRIASHNRSYKKGYASTVKEHMPKSHQEYSDWSPSRIINWARTIGPLCSHLVKKIMDEREHPELAYRSCLGIIRLERKYSKERLENACKRALKIGATSYKSIKSILDKGLDGQEFEINKEAESIVHENIRGSDYYH